MVSGLIVKEVGNAMCFLCFFRSHDMGLGLGLKPRRRFQASKTEYRLQILKDRL